MTVQLQSHPEGVLLPVRAHAGGKRNEILPPREGMLRVSVTQAPERGKANKAIIGVLAQGLGLRKSQIMLHSGETAREKKFLVQGVTQESLAARIAELGLTEDA